MKTITRKWNKNDFLRVGKFYDILSHQMKILIQLFKKYFIDSLALTRFHWLQWRFLISSALQTISSKKIKIEGKHEKSICIEGANGLTSHFHLQISQLSSLKNESKKKLKRNSFSLFRQNDDNSREESARERPNTPIIIPPRLITSCSINAGKKFNFRVLYDVKRTMQ